MLSLSAVYLRMHCISEYLISSIALGSNYLSLDIDMQVIGYCARARTPVASFLCRDSTFTFPVYVCSVIRHVIW